MENEREWDEAGPDSLRPRAESTAWLRREGLKALFFAVALGPLPWAFATWPRQWWLPAALWLSGVRLAWAWGEPFFLRQVIHLGPLPDEAAVERIRALAGPVRLACWHLAESSTSVQAMTIGLGKHPQILLSDTLLKLGSTADILGVVAHELSHCHRQDSLRRWGVASVLMTGILATAALCALDPLLDLMLLALSALGGAALYMAYGRHLEYVADRAAIDTLGDAEAYGRTLGRIARANREAPQAPKGFAGWFQTHPALADRLKRLGLEP